MRGRGRRLRARHDGAGLRRRSPVPHALQADGLGRERRRARALFPVGPRVQGRPRRALDRRVHPPVARRHDDPHRDPRRPLPVRRPPAVRGSRHALRPGGRQGNRAGVHRGQARRARRPPPARRRVALRRRAEREGGQGRPARPADPVLDRQVLLPREEPRRPREGGRLRAQRIPAVPEVRGLPVGGPLPPALHDRARRGAADLRRAARARPPARLHAAPGPARRRALHEALLPGRQGRRRPDAHLLRDARGAARQEDARAVALHGAAAAAPAGPDRRERGLRRRVRPHQRRRRGVLRARPGQPDPDLPPRRQAQSVVPPRRAEARPALAQADRHGRAQRSRGEPPVHARS